MEEIELDGELVEFKGQSWFRGALIPRYVGHSVFNPNERRTVLIVAATREHGTEDVFACEM